MPYALNNGVRIYYESVGDGPPIVLMHGLWDDLRCWYEAGYVDALRSDYRLILFDARGHGASDKPHDPAEYFGPNYLSDVFAILDAARVERPVFWGYSLGARVGFGLGDRAPSRFRALILGGSAGPNPGPERVAQLASAVSQGREAYETFLNGLLGGDSPGFKHRWLSGDLQAFGAAIQALLTLPEQTAESLARFPMPCFAYAGDRDGTHERVRQAAADLSLGTFTSLPGLNHITALTRGDLVVPHVRGFLARIGSVELAQ
jgi:pimeloyl-ACP methyl ester carboxylesterase